MADVYDKKTRRFNMSPDQLNQEHRELAPRPSDRLPTMPAVTFLHLIEKFTLSIAS